MKTKMLDDEEQAFRVTDEYFAGTEIKLSGNSTHMITATYVPLQFGGTILCF